MQSIVSITFFTHGTTTDNEKGIATGWLPGQLSEKGRRECLELGEMLSGQRFQAVFCSNLGRAIDSARLMFYGSREIIEDMGLRECNYGDMNGKSAAQVDSMMKSCIEKPFPNGESYRDVENRMKVFLSGLLHEHAGEAVAIVGHRATQLALEVVVSGRTWQQAMDEDWRLMKPRQWRPGWHYVVTGQKLGLVEPVA